MGAFSPNPKNIHTSPPGRSSSTLLLSPPTSVVAMDNAAVPSRDSALLSTSGQNGLALPLAVNYLEPIAIIGLSCRFPGDASGPQKLWSRLAEGTSTWSKTPGDRFNLDAFYDPSNPYASTTNTTGGHFLSDDIRAFDAAFFGIDPLEAKDIDPQHRMLLEVAYEAFENAGMNAERLWASNTGVYVGQWTSDYTEMISQDMGFSEIYHTPGTGPDITSNRISHQFNLHGPSVTVDTVFSASLVALHLAVQSLRSRETDMNFVGGVNLLLDPHRFTYQSQPKMFSDDGRCFSFDHRANGYGLGEGCSGIVLKTLSAALRDGDNVRAVIRNTVLNQDGRTPGITAPSDKAQETAILKAYAEAGLELGADYVEVHGTGKAVGDPIELRAIASALARSRSPNDLLPVGSIEANIGHARSAAGLAGIIKAVLMLEKGAIPPQVNVEKANKDVFPEDWKLRIPIALEACHLRRISVNSFGYSGTNAHVIIDSAAQHVGQSAKPDDTTTGNTKHRVFVLSAASEGSCKLAATNLVDWVSQTATCTTDKQWMNRLAYTLNTRTIYKHQVSIVASNAESLLTKLRAVAQKPIPASSPFKSKRLAFVFSGQGAQYYNMGRELINVWPPFTASLERANKHLATLGCTWDVFCELKKERPESRLDEPAFGQPLFTTIQLALVDSLAALKIVPAAVVGHSSGEIAAAYCAGFLSFEDALKVSYHGGRLTSELLLRESRLPGAMLAVGASPSTVQEYIAGLGPNSQKVTIACYNSPSSVTVSGDLATIEALSQSFEADYVFNIILPTKGAAYHSNQMQRIEKEYLQALEGLVVRDATSITMISSLSGMAIRSTEVDRNYWVNNLVSPVLFEDALRELCQSPGTSSIDAVIEVGPHGQLERPIKQTLQSLSGNTSKIKYVSTLDRKTNAVEALLGSLGYLFRKGIRMDLHHANNDFNQQLPTLLTDLPSYAFDHQQTY